MNQRNQFREKMLESPTYWVEGINGLLYNAIVSFMDDNKMKRKDLAKHLNISAGRVSQILNEGDINFSLEKIVEISLKVNTFPLFDLVNKQVFHNKERKESEAKKISIFYNYNELLFEGIMDDNQKIEHDPYCEHSALKFKYSFERSQIIEISHVEIKE